MKKSKIILIGAIEEGRVATNGESRKNQLFLERFRELFDEVITIDTINWRKQPWIAFKILWVLLVNPDAKIVISASMNARYLIDFLYILPFKRDVYCWVVGGSHARLIKEGVYNIKTQTRLKKIIVQGKSMVKELNELGLQNVVYVPNSKPVYIIQKAQTQKKDLIKFVFLSRIHPDKGLKEIIEACKELNKNGYHDRYSVDFYGAIDKGYNNDFSKLITTCDNVQYRGFLNLTDRTGYEKLAVYDVMLFPTYWAGEGFPGIVIDSYMAGIPIIATDWMLNSEVIEEGKTGTFIPIRNSNALYEKMAKFIDSEYDIQKMSKNCLEHAIQFDYKTVINRELMEQLELL